MQMYLVLLLVRPASALDCVAVWGRGKSKDFRVRLSPTLISP